MTSKFDSMGNAYVGGMDNKAEEDFMTEAAHDAAKISEPVWRFAGTEHWSSVKEHITELIEREQTRLEDSDSLDSLRFSQGFIKGLRRIIHFVEINAQYFESLQDEQVELSTSPEE